MRNLNQKPGFSHLSGLVLAVALFASPLAASAQTQLCELDWNCDGHISMLDVYKYEPGGLAEVKSTGFYSDVYYYTVYHDTYPEYVDGGYYHHYMQCGTPGNMDWNGDGVIDMSDAYEGTPSAAKLDNFYTQYYVWFYYHSSYLYFYPHSDCVPELPTCDGKCGGFASASGIGCWCDDACVERDDCCHDYEEYCVEVNPCAGIGDADGDGVCDDVDNCPNTPNPGQENTYGDERGDACEPVECPAGFEPQGTECVDIDECALGTDNCSQNCLNNDGGYTCGCNSGWTLNADGFTCAERCLGWELIDVGGPDAPGLPYFFEELGGKLYFVAIDPVAGEELMVYDPATEAVTVASDINPGPGGSGVRDLTAHEGKLYFQANDFIGGYDAELFVFDPATGVSTKIDLNATSSSLPNSFYSASNGLLYFRARDEINDQELWEYNPITGQHTIYEIYPGMAQFGPNSGTPKEMLEYDGIIYMAATGVFGQEFYSFNMVTKEIQLIADIATGFTSAGNAINSYPQNLAVFNGEIFFNANLDGIYDAELWIYNPVNGTVREIEIDSGLIFDGGSFVETGGAPNHLTPYNGKLYFSAQQVPIGVELFAYDPVTDDVDLVWDSAPGQLEVCYGPQGAPPCLIQGNSGNTGYLTLLNDKFYFSAPFDNRELWEWDPATGQGQQIIELAPGLDSWGNPLHGDPAHMVVFDDKLVFRGNTDQAQDELIIVSWTPENCS